MRALLRARGIYLCADRHDGCAVVEVGLSDSIVEEKALEWKSCCWWSSSEVVRLNRSTLRKWCRETFESLLGGRCRYAV